MHAVPPRREIDAKTMLRLRRIERIARTDPAQAAELAREALRDGVVHPLLHDLSARRLMDLGRAEEATEAFGRGLALDPSNVGMIIGVGFCLLQMDRNDEAHTLFGLAVRLAPADPIARYGLGGACERCDDLAEAERQFLEAVRLSPTHVGGLVALASLARRRGDLEAAAGFARRALAFDPHNGDAGHTLAAVDLARGDANGAEIRLDGLLASGRLSPRDAAYIRITLGDTLDALGRPTEALAAYASGKSDLRRLYRPLYGAPGVESARAEAERLAREFEGLVGADFTGRRARRPTHGPTVHGFLVGFPRSGTTLLEQVLAAHGDVVTLEERPALAGAEAAFVSTAGGLSRLAQADEDTLEAHRRDYWRRVGGFGVEPSGRVFIDKMPLGVIDLPVVARLFPEARVLFAVRDPRDVVLSCFRRAFRMNIAMYEFLSLESTARYYDAVMRLAFLYRERLALDVHEVRYDRIVEDFDAEISSAAAFLGLPPDVAMADFAARARERRIATPSAHQIAKGLNREGLGVWRRYATALAPVTPILAPWIERFGYPLD